MGQADTQISGSDGFDGKLANIQLVDLVQMCCMSALDLRLRVTQGGLAGEVCFSGGNVIDATCRGLRGEAAFYEIMRWENGQFHTQGMTTTPERTVRQPWQSLLMEVMRRADEAAASGTGNAAGAGTHPIRLMIVDDSAMMRRALEGLLAGESVIGDIAIARNGEEALARLPRFQPDVIALDVNMPVMDGRTALKHIMIQNPCPVIIFSSIGDSSSARVLEFLHLGAVDFISKPTRDETLEQMKEIILEKIQLAARARIRHAKRIRAKPPVDRVSVPAGTCAPASRLVVVNAGTGGYGELIRLVPTVTEKHGACLLLRQHMPRKIVPAFAGYLDQRSPSRIRPLDENGPIERGRGYLCPRHDRVEINGDDDGWVLSGSTHAVGSHGFDDLLTRIADAFPGKVLAVLLSGADVGGIDGLHHTKSQGVSFVAQAPETCMVPEPVEVAIRAGLIDIEVQPQEIADAILQLTC